jgi:hypothetical protein
VKAVSTGLGRGGVPPREIEDVGRDVLVQRLVQGLVLLAGERFAVPVRDPENGVQRLLYSCTTSSTS